ncbi:MAG: Uncharacterised protein [Rhodospirillaceae bacterium]|nr:MAG: Uncharacterised protein [Rhodospirillaceae bacterium]
MLVNQEARLKARQRKRCGQFSRLAAGDVRSEGVARTRGRLEPARTPAAVEVHVAHRCRSQDRARVRTDVDDTAPLAQHLHPLVLREQLADRHQGLFGQLLGAALPVGNVLIHARADHQFTLVGLGDIGVDGIRHHHGVDCRLDRFRDQRLQRVALHRQVEAGHRRQHRGMSGRDQPDLLGLDRPLGGLHALDHAAFDIKAGDAAVLDDVHAHLVALAGVAPGDGVVAGGPTAGLERGTQHGIASTPAQVDARYLFLHTCGVEIDGIDTVEPVGVHPPLGVAHVGDVVGEVHDPALAEHDVVVQVLGQAFPQLHGVFVDRR